MSKQKGSKNKNGVKGKTTEQSQRMAILSDFGQWFPNLPQNPGWRHRFLDWLFQKSGYTATTLCASMNNAVGDDTKINQVQRNITKEANNYDKWLKKERKKRRDKRRRLTEGAGESKITESRTDEEQDAIDAGVVAAFEEPERKKKKRKKR